MIILNVCNFADIEDVTLSMARCVVAGNLDSADLNYLTVFDWHITGWNIVLLSSDDRCPPLLHLGIALGVIQMLVSGQHVCKSLRVLLHVLVNFGGLRAVNNNGAAFSLQVVAKVVLQLRDDCDVH